MAIFDKNTFLNMQADIDQIGEAINEKKIVTPRIGGAFKSIPLVVEEAEQHITHTLQTLNFEAEAAIVDVINHNMTRGFSTETILREWKPDFNGARAKADDTKKIWRWELTSAVGVTPIIGNWLDTGLSDKDLAENFAKLEIAKLAGRIPQQPFNDNILFEFADVEGEIVLQIFSDGSVKCVGLEDSIQKVISNIFEKINQTESYVQKTLAIDSHQNLFSIVDSEENLIAYFDKDSKLYLVGLDGDVVSAINAKSEDVLVATKDTSNLANYSYKDTFIPKAQNLLNFFRNNQDVGLLAPVPLQSFEQNFSIGTDWINDAKITEWGSYIPVKTPYGNNRGVVHPQILEFPGLFMGCRYILAITGYTGGNTQEENPFLLGSNDLENFELLTSEIDVPEDFYFEHGIVYNSDPFMFLDHKTSELCLIIRECYGVTDGQVAWKEYLYIRRTKDGKTWSEREPFMFDFSGLFMSPTVIFDAKTELYHVYGVGNVGGKIWGIHHYTTKKINIYSLDNWTYVGACNFPVSDAPWHIDMKIVGDKLVATYQNRSGSDSVGFKLGISDDYHNFVWAESWWNPQTYEVYKASFITEFNENNEMRLIYVWTTNHKPTSELRYKLFVQATPFLNVKFSEK